VGERRGLLSRGAAWAAVFSCVVAWEETTAEVHQT